MTDKSNIEPALSAEEWAIGMVVRGEEFDGDGMHAQVNSVLGFMVDNYCPETQSSHQDPNHLAAIIALANAALPDDDPRKITRQDLAMLRRAGGEFIDRGDCDALERLHRLRAVLASYLPPAD